MMATNPYELPSVPQVWQPADLEQAWEAKQALGDDGRFAAGGTLLRTQWESGLVPMPRHLISLEGIASMRGVYALYTAGASELHIGALTTLSDGAQHALIERQAPALTEACKRIAAPSVRRQGTLGGNVLSQVGDSIPALLVNDATLVWYQGSGWTEQLLNDWLEQKKKDPAPERKILSHLMLNTTEWGLDGEKGLQKFVKVGRREAFTASVVTVALAMSDVPRKNGSLKYIRLAVGGGASPVIRLTEAEQLLLDKPLSGKLLGQIHSSIQAQWPAAHDAFASSDYRKLAAANVLVAELWKLLKSSSS
ncbi:FAD binding domain-containing protein [Paenibacillus rigui]|uniref:FAD-binding PCMH-type domain-containing protein n=1 Tax=Paenibacillus rigui TaxID=554312 RepID=A0A229UWY7_9BACL|nr:FAD binding domain-containing protein [Paenibacillus rigui]OXM87771.1 hypothetical protein CF651_01240 [Paenibacillus rigui]